MKVLEYELKTDINHDTNKEYTFLYIPKLAKKVFLSDAEILLLNIYEKENYNNIEY